MALSGLLGGLANLGAVYGGAQKSQALSTENQVRQLYLQQLLQQQQSQDAAWGDISSGRLNQLLQPIQMQPIAPTANPLPSDTSAGGPSYQPGAVTSYPLTPPPTPTQTAAIGPLSGLGGSQPFGPSGGPLLAQSGGGAIPTGQPGSPFGPSLPPTFGGGGTIGPDQNLATTGGGLPSYNVFALAGDTSGPALTRPSGPVLTRPSPVVDPRGIYPTAPPPPDLSGLDGNGQQQPAVRGVGGGGGIAQPVQVSSLGGPTSLTQPSPVVDPGGIYPSAPPPSAGDTRAAGAAAGDAGFGQVVQIESGGDMNIGPGAAGEIGPAQILPSTAAPYTRPGEDINDPQTNLAIGKRYYDDLLRLSGGDQAAALVGYNRGKGAMRTFQAAGDNLDALRGSERPTAEYQRAIIRAGGKGTVDDRVTGAMRTSRTMWQQSTTPREQQASSLGTMSILQRYPMLGRMTGTFDMDGLARMIEQNHPGASPGVKVGIFQNLFNLLQPIAKEQFAQTIDLVKTDIAEQERAATQQETAKFHAAEERHWRRTEEAGRGTPSIIEVGPDKTPMVFDPRTRSAAPLMGPGGQPITTEITKPGTGARGAGGKPQSLQLTYPDGRTEEVYAQFQGPGKIVSVVTGQLIDLPQGTQITPLRAPGRQSAAQINAMLGSSNEVVRAANNLVDLPITATSGWFKGVTQHTPEGLEEALLRSLGNTVTSEEAKAVTISFQGVQRAIATLEAQGRATGLVGLTQQASVLMPQEGDTGMDILRKYAEIRQLTEAALDTLSVNPDIGKAQAEKIRGMQDKIAATIPWSVRDVNALERDPSTERVADFAKRFGATGAAAREGGTAPTEQPSADAGAAVPAAPSTGATRPIPRAASEVGDITTMTLDDIAHLPEEVVKGMSQLQLTQLRSRIAELQKAQGK